MKKILFLLFFMPLFGISQAKFGGNSVAAARASLKNSNTYTLTYVDGIFYLVSTTTSYPIAFSTVGATGTGNLVYATSPTLVTPNLGTPSAVTLTNGTGLPVSTGISGLGSGIATFLATPSSANLLAAMTTKTGTGSLVFNTNPTFSGEVGKNDANGYMIYANRAADGGNYGVYYDTGAADIRIFTNSSARITAKSDGKVGIGTISPSGILHVASTTSFALLCPMTTTQRNALTGLVAGAEIYCSDCTATDASTGVKQVYNGSAWKNCW